MVEGFTLRPNIRMRMAPFLSLPLLGASVILMCAHDWLHGILVMVVSGSISIIGLLQLKNSFFRVDERGFEYSDTFGKRQIMQWRDVTELKAPAFASTPITICSRSLVVEVPVTRFPRGITSGIIEMVQRAAPNAKLGKELDRFRASKFSVLNEFKRFR